MRARSELGTGTRVPRLAGEAAGPEMLVLSIKGPRSGVPALGVWGAGQLHPPLPPLGKGRPRTGIWEAVRRGVALCFH